MNADMKIDGVTALALVLIASFAIDRIVTAILFLASLTPIGPDPATAHDIAARLRAERAYKLVYYVIAAMLGVVVLAYFGKVRILSAMGVATSPIIDTFITGLLLMGGAERLSTFIQGPITAQQSESEPTKIEMTGTLKLDDAGRRLG